MAQNILYSFAYKLKEACKLMPSCDECIFYDNRGCGSCKIQDPCNWEVSNNDKVN